ncbi:hypothetical protein FB547_107206 [Variovorax beijingensis]|jgi:hypothetical protein|uniref:Formate dehydrogenase n=2 Tax=Variovorax TaxID=34072 RepID=A0AAE3XZB8_VARPD|nr:MULTISPECIES: formate dehydrogenase [Variovorax]MBD9662850.1 formate dehydrogenase [Variovorax sp. VRV01]MDP9963260.1 hypothetical protein [Variovorax paradoxus]MDR6426488.1 hypothetical protein [Variovorax paradoxus]TWD78671.1 hypothetical protein FB547_107206 [Variovorax beijingensis]
MQDSQAAGTQPASRRGFFLGAAGAGAAVAAVSVLPKMVDTPAAAVEAAAPAAKPAPEKGGGYSLSEHVKRYYKTASA